MRKDIRKIIKWTLKQLGMHSEEAAELVYSTGEAESGYRALSQQGGPAIGFFQVEPNTLWDVWDNYVTYRPELKSKLYALGFEEADAEVRVKGSIILQVAFCRLQYRRDKQALPDALDVNAQAKYWKRVYNTELGKGTITHFLNANKRPIHAQPVLRVGG